jgi:sarcosine oxidase subunit alpha
MDAERILDHPVLGRCAPPRPVSFTYAGQALTGWEGDTVATALWAAGIRALPRGGGAVGAALYCGIGHCFTCRLTVDGVQGVRGCLVPLRAGMRLEPDPEEKATRHAD